MRCRRPNHSPAVDGWGTRVSDALRGCALRTRTTAWAVTILLFVAASVSGSAPADRAAARRLEGVCQTPVWTVAGTQTDARFGTVAPAGDVNGDGYADVLVGAYNEDHPEVDEGVVRVYLGGPNGLSTTPAALLECNQAGAHFGDKLSSAGDVNGDGYDDVIVGAGLYDHNGTDSGAAFVYLGSPTGLSTTPAWIVYGDQAGANFGACAQAAGDVNGDGYDDVIVGAWLYDADGLVDQGRAYLYLGSPTGLSTTPAWIGQCGSAGAVYGYFCAGAGDLNHDGYDDIVVGARRWSGNGLSNEGRVFVYYGSPTGPSTTPSWTHDGGQAGGEFGAYAIGAGDVNGDGFDDLIVGAFRYDHPSKDEGMAFVFMGSATGLADTAAWTAEGNQTGAYFGYHLDGAGDVNGDGYDDVVVSVESWDAGALTDAGRAVVYLGSPTGLSATPAWIQDGDQAGAGIDAVRGVGDVNGDGFDDFMTGSLYHDDAFVDGGRAYLFYGCSNGRTDVASADPAPPGLRVIGPNPFAHSTTLGFSTRSAGPVHLTLHDLAGRTIAVLTLGRLDPGDHRVTWDGRTRAGLAAPAGVYFARLEADGVVWRTQLVLAR